MAHANLFEKLEKEHQDLLNRIDDLDKRIADALNEWGKSPELSDLQHEQSVLSFEKAGAFVPSKND